MRLVAGSVVLCLSLLASHLAAASPHRTVFLSGNKTIAPLASEAPKVSVNASTAASAAATNKPIENRPAYNGGTAGSGVVTTTAATGTTETYYEGGEGCDIFGIGGDDDDSEGANTVIVNNPPPKGDDDDSSKGDDDDDNKKKGDDDDDNKSESSSSSSSSGSTDSSEHTLSVKLQGTHAQNVPQHHGHSPVSRIALASALILLPLRRRKRQP